jgi:hypothetical protein
MGACALLEADGLFSKLVVTLLRGVGRRITEMCGLHGGIEIGDGKNEFGPVQRSLESSENESKVESILLVVIVVDLL